MHLAALSTELAGRHAHVATGKVRKGIACRGIASVAAGNETCLTILHDDRGSVGLARQEHGHANNIEHTRN